MCLKYNSGSLKTQSNDANYHRLVKILKFSTTKMQYAHDNQEDFTWVVTGLKGRGKEVDKYFGICGANSQEDYGATNNEPNNHEEHQHSNPLQQNISYN